MKERPILFSAPMVRAILEGRKTQTRRAVKLNDAGRVKRAGKQWHIDDPAVIEGCPYGAVGSLLWVRETWCEAHPLCFQEGRIGQRLLYAGIPGPPGVSYLVAYRADGELLPVWPCSGYPYRSREPRDDDDRKFWPTGTEPAWHPSIHMPRRASRITLEITGVRVERLQKISSTDALAEGIQSFAAASIGCTDAYRELWESINGAGSWDANPWVWVVEFKRIEAARAAA